MKITILLSAMNDINEGYFFYEQQSQGVGSYFLDSIYSDIDSLHLYAGIHPKKYKNYFRMQSGRFPFSVFYAIEDTSVIVFAVLDSRRSPAWIRKNYSNF
ncbi:MAG: type II toxin-antitoxin system RelE/ParE family toxin [Spirochaetes bacterium]|jgi:hypothetical protein|nr:type II toxin-antitoxin system RelE/ParE family toxin [Spirochaetota bacterium]